MKSVVFYEPGKFLVEDKPIPPVKDGEVLLKVISCGLCGTDLKIFTHGHHAIKPPITTGHEIVGQVVESKSDDKKIKVGDNVIVVTPVGCMKCKYCWQNKQNMCPWVANEVHSIGYYCDGGFAEYVVIPKEAVDQKVLIHIPESVIKIEDFALCEPLSCVINGQDKLRITPEDTVTVIGAGPIGCMHVFLSRAKGVKKIILADISKNKLELARKNNIPADFFVDSTQTNLVDFVLEETGAAGSDVTIVAAPSGKAQEDAVQLTAILGRISFFAGLPKNSPSINFPSNILHYREQELYGAFASNRKNYEQALSLILNGQIDAEKLVTHYLPLEKIHEAAHLAKTEHAIKIIIVP